MTSDLYKNILIGVSGGIAAYKIPFLVRLLKKRGHNVKVILTENATSLVGVDALKTLTGNPVYTDIVDDAHDMGHIRLEEWADMFIVAPATANTIGKMAHGIADNLLTTLALSITGPTVVVPAMNTNMWNHPAVVANLEILQSRGVVVLPVGEGELACGVVGAGRMIEPEDIVEYIPLVETKLDLSGKNVLITSGPTEEAVDMVRVLTNKSSGTMGAALARAALLGQADRVTVVTGPAAVALPAGVKVVSVKSALEMKDAVELLMGEYDLFVMAAAVSDFRVKEQCSGKIDRRETGDLSMELIKNPDIAAMVGGAKDYQQKLVTFSLEVDGDLDRARAKMNKKGADLAVFNKVEEALGGSSTSITLLTHHSSDSIAHISKIEAAEAIFQKVISL